MDYILIHILIIIGFKGEAPKEKSQLKIAGKREEKARKPMKIDKFLLITQPTIHKLRKLDCVHVCECIKMEIRSEKLATRERDNIECNYVHSQGDRF